MANSNPIGSHFRKQQPTQSDVHVDRPLTNIAVAYLQDAANFIADRFAPLVASDKQSDKYFKFDKGMLNRDEMARRADCTESKKVGYTVSQDSFFIDVWSLGHEIGDQRRANTDAPLDPDRNAVQLLMHKALIRREREFASTFLTTGVWGTDLTGVSGAPAGGQFRQWDQALSTPIADIEQGKLVVAERTGGFEPNTLVMDRRTWGKLKTNPDLIDRLKYAGGVSNLSPAQVTAQAVAALFEVDQILVAKSVYNSAAEGAADSHSYIAGKNALLAYVAPAAGIEVPSAAYMFGWTGLYGAADGVRIMRFRDDKRRCDIVEVDMAFDFKVVGSDLGYFFSGTIA